MKRFLFSILFFVGVVSFGFGQATFVAAQDGNWNDGATWGNASPGTAGVDFPSSIDDAFTNGFNITTAAPSSARNVFVEDGATAITFQQSLTVTGTMTGWSGGQFGFTSDLTSNVFSGNSRITFTAVNYNDANNNVFNDEILAFWNDNTPITVVTFDFSGSHTIDAGFSGGDIQITQLLFSNGDLSTGFNLSGLKILQLLRISSGTFNVGVPIYGSTGSLSKLSSLQLTGGDLNLTSSNSYCNANNIAISNGSSLIVGFSGSNQTQGWWFDNTFPATFNIAVNSTVEYSGNADQSIFAISTGYGNLILNSSNSVTKTLVGSGNLLVKGNLNISSAAVTFTSTNINPITVEGNISNEGTWSTSQRVNFTGTNNQVINGSNPITFGEEVRIDKSSGNVTLQLVDQTINADLRILQGTFIPLARTVTLSGDIINDGTIEATQNGSGGFIFDGTTEISGTGTTQFRNATINNGATLSLATGNEIDLTTNFTNNGTFTHNDGLVRFAQSGTKSISGSSTTSFYDLAVEGGTVNVNGTVDLENTLTFVGSPTIDFDGGGSGVFTLKSTQTQDASIANVGTANLIGEMNAERAVYTLRGDNKGYHIIGFPVDGATVGEVQNSGFAVTGNFTGASITGTQGDGFASIFGYDQSAAGDFSNGYTNFPGSGGSTASEFINGDGYFMFTYEGDAPGTITTTGTVHTGEFTKSLPYTANGVVPTEDEGWHMVANPFPSATDWDLWDKTDNIELDAWLWDPSAGAFVALVDGQGDILPQGQGFFIRSLPGAGSITVNENAKVSTTTTFLRNPEPSQIFKVGLDNGDFVDYTYIGLKEGTSFDYNGKEDASRLLNNNETISTKTADGKSVKVNRIPFQTADACGNSIFINLEQMVNDKEYALKFENVSNLSSKAIQLYDHYLDQTIELNSTDLLQFTVNADAASKGSTRFEIIISNKSPNSVAVEVQDICPSENAVINLQQSDDFANYLVYQGEEVVASAEGTGAALSIEVLNEFLVDSTNTFEIKAFAAGCDTVNVGNASVQVFESLSVNNAVEGSSICKAETQATFSVATQINTSYYVLNGSDTIQSFEGNGNLYEGLIDSTELVDGLNQFTIAANKDGCQSGTLSQALEIEVQNPIIDESITFSSTNACYKTPTDISFLSQSGVEYQILKGTTLVKTIAGDGSQQTVEITEANLSLGLNEFTVLAQYGECKEYEFPEPIQIEVEENINNNLSLITENICGDNNTTILIENAQAGKIYTLQNTDGNVSSLTATEDGELSFNLNPNQLNIGLNEFDIQIEGEYRGAVTSANKAQITMFEPINTNLNYQTVSSCNSTDVIVGIQNAQAGKTYYLYKGVSLIETIETIEGDSIVFEAANNALNIGQNEFTVKIEGEGCGIETALQTLNVDLFEEINASLEITSSDVCYGEDVVIEIGNPQTNKTYTLKNSEGIITSKLADSTEALSFVISSDQFTVGSQEISIEISDDNCGTVEANSTSFTLYESINSNLSYFSANTCNSNEAVVGIQNAQAGKIYRLYKGETLVESITANTNGELIFANANNELVEGVNTFNIQIEGEGCGVVDVEQNLSITLFESINPNLDIISPDVCSGDQVNIEITNPQVGKTYRLMASENIMATEIADNGDVLSFSLPSNHFGIGYHALTIDIIDDNCGTLTANQTVEFELFDTAVITEVENLNACKGESVTVDLSANVAMGSYQLYVGEELISEVTNSTLNLSPTETTTYTLTGIPESGCSVNTVNFTIEVTDLATPGILVSNNVLESSVEGDSYQWYLNGEILDGENGKVLVAQESGDYSVEVSKSNCTKISDAYTFSEEVLNANKALANALNLYPNPVVDVLKIDMENINELEITIYTLSGKFMDKMNLNSDNEQSIDMSKFSKGTYLIQLKSGKGSITKRIIKK